MVEAGREAKERHDRGKGEVDEDKEAEVVGGVAVDIVEGEREEKLVEKDLQLGLALRRGERGVRWAQ